MVGQLEALKPLRDTIDFRTREGYEQGKTCIQQCTKLRSAIEAKRKALKEPALEWGRKVDAEAKALVGLVEELEAPLKERKLLVDREEEARRREAERAEREANERAAQEAAAERAKLEAERARLEQLKAEQAHGGTPSNEGAKPEPQGPAGIPPRRPAPNPAPSDASEADPYTVAGWRILNEVLMGKGYGFECHKVGAAVQFAIHGNHRAWHGSGSTLAQAVELAWERHEKNPADVAQ